MSSSTPRTNPPERLSGVPDPPLIEIAPGRPWLTVEETNRLIRQQGLSLAIAQAWVLDEIVAVIPLQPETEKSLIRQFMESQGVGSDEELGRWLDSKHLSFDDLRYFATKRERVKRWQERRYGEEAELRFLERKLELDRVVYSMLRVSNQELAEELYHRLKEGEADFPELAVRYSQGQEKNTRGLIGPVPLAAGHPELATKLRISRPGQLWPPFVVVDVWVVMRFEQLLPAQLDQDMRGRMIEELFQVWFRERVQLLMDGDPLPPLPHLPPDDAPLSAPTATAAS
jgi:parvulin-like peptidyl-prolyl isomerase